MDAGGYFKSEQLPPPLAAAVAHVAEALGLGNKWFDTDAASLMDFGLPPGWEERVEVRRYGALEVHLPARFDQICLKLYGAADRGPDHKHFADLQALEPSPDELRAAMDWTMEHDQSRLRGQLIGCISSLGVEIDDDGR